MVKKNKPKEEAPIMKEEDPFMFVIPKRRSGSECLCKRHKPELKKLYYAFLYHFWPKETQSIGVRIGRGRSSQVIPFEEVHPRKAGCIACIQIYLQLLKDALGEKTSEVFLNRNCPLRQSCTNENSYVQCS